MNVFCNLLKLRPASYATVNTRELAAFALVSFSCQHNVVNHYFHGGVLSILPGFCAELKFCTFKPCLLMFIRQCHRGS